MKWEFTESKDHTLRVGIGEALQRGVEEWQLERCLFCVSHEGAQRADNEWRFGLPDERHSSMFLVISCGGERRLCFLRVGLYYARMLTKVAQSRRDYIFRQRGEKIGRILEIGAFDNPTFRRELGDNVEYLDFFSRAELIKMHVHNPRRNPSAAVEVDHVVKSSNFAEQITPGFGCIVAHHVIEHVPDLIFWFEEVEKLLARSGLLYLSIPDRRYTFDFFRPVSLATQMMRAHAEGLERPDVWQLTEAFYYHMKVDVAALWAGNPPARLVPRFSLAKAHQMAQAKCSEYTDAHCWVFTAESFAQCMGDLQSARLLSFAITHLEEPQTGANEFRVVLTPNERRNQDST